MDGSSGSASTNQTATFGYGASDTAEQALAVPANPEGLGTSTPKVRGSLVSPRRPRSPVTSGAIREVSTSSRHSAFSMRRKTSVIRKTKSSPETGQHEVDRVNPRLSRRKGLPANVEIADDSDMRDDNGPRSAGLVCPPADSSRDLGGGLNLKQAISLKPKGEPTLNFNIRHSQIQQLSGLILSLRSNSAEVQKKGSCS